jgi:hypothetical protein
MQRERKFRAWDKSLKKFYTDDEYLMVCHDKVFFKYDGGTWKISNTDIFEGDIMNGNFGTGIGMSSTRYKAFNFEIEWTQNYGFHLVMPKDYGRHRFLPHLDQCEVIGNIYESPELLNKKQ